MNCLYKTLEFFSKTTYITYNYQHDCFHKTSTFKLPCNQYPQDSTTDICDLWNLWLAKDSKSVTPIGRWPTFQNSVFKQIVYIGDRVCLCNWVSSGCQTSTIKMSLKLSASCQTSCSNESSNINTFPSSHSLKDNQHSLNTFWNSKPWQ